MRPLLIAIVLGNSKISPIRKVLQILHSILILPEHTELLWDLRALSYHAGLAPEAVCQDNSTFLPDQRLIAS
jgi:hypothetical protein